jgi:hypothetical protein
MLIAIGLIHQVVGLAVGLGVMEAPDGSRSSPLLDLLRSGVVGQAEANPVRMAMVWFLLFGFALIFAGATLLRATPSRGLALGLAALCGLGVVLMPASGFWLGFIPAVQLWRQSRPEKRLQALPGL